MEVSYTMRQDYLKRLPPEFSYVGRLDMGEIEISDDCVEGTGVVYENDRLMVIVDPVKFPPDGSTGTYHRVIEKAQLSGVGGTIILPIVDGQVVFVELFRHATRRWEWELPRGYQEASLSAQQNAIKETKEEIGVTPARVQELGPISPNTGLLSSETSAFVAYLPDGSASQLRGQRSEAIRQVCVIPGDELNSFVVENVRCGFSLATLYLAQIARAIPRP